MLQGLNFQQDFDGGIGGRGTDSFFLSIVLLKRVLTSLISVLRFSYFLFRSLTKKAIQ